MSWKRLFCLLVVLVVSLQLMAVTCTPDVIDHKSDAGNSDTATTDNAKADNAKTDNAGVDTSTPDQAGQDQSQPGDRVAPPDRRQPGDRTAPPDRAKPEQPQPDQAPDQTPDTPTVPDAPPVAPGTACIHDCDCYPNTGVCDKGVCDTTSKRKSTCPVCDVFCRTGQPCFEKNGSVGICKIPSGLCKNDCHCYALGKVCDTRSERCVKSSRANKCKACPNCATGEYCYNKDKSITQCKKAGECLHDCECVGKGEVCDSITKKCTKSTRRTTCRDCAPRCTRGLLCHAGGGVIETCMAPSCQGDCDCRGFGGVCEQGKCNKFVRRASTCITCRSGKCKSGERCLRLDGTIGTCGVEKSCTQDCECYSLGQVCESGKCILSSRPTRCLACHDVNCKAGTPCRQSTGAIGACPAPGRFACGTGRCQTGAAYCLQSLYVGSADCSASLKHLANSCPADCRVEGGCAGRVKCRCPKYICKAFTKTVCKDCACVKSSGQEPPGHPKGSWSCRSCHVQKQGTVPVYACIDI